MLVVDDAAENRVARLACVAQNGLWVEEADDGRVAVEMALKGGFDVIFMDMQMPVMDGYSATRAIRAAGLKILIVAPSGQRDARARAADEEGGMRPVPHQADRHRRARSAVASLLGGRKLDPTASAPRPASFLLRRKQVLRSS